MITFFLSSMLNCWELAYTKLHFMIWEAMQLHSNYTCMYVCPHNLPSYVAEWVYVWYIYYSILTHWINVYLHTQHTHTRISYIRTYICADLHMFWSYKVDLLICPYNYTEISFEISRQKFQAQQSSYLRTL